MECGENEEARISFVKTAIDEHREGDLYRTASDAQKYYDGENPTINHYEKILYDIQGRAHKDMYTANHKIASHFFGFVVDQESSYLLGNGVTMKDATKKKLGADFDQQMSRLAEYAMIGGVSFGFWNLDHLDVFEITEFVPLYDEENGALMAGIRFWQIGPEKPMRCTLYELDGYTEYAQKMREDLRVMQEKRKYILHHPPIVIYFPPLFLWFHRLETAGCFRQTGPNHPPHGVSAHRPPCRRPLGWSAPLW